MTSPIEHFTAVIPAGGAGTRLWPLSRAGAPKFLHDLTGTGRSLLQGTWDRLAPLAGPDRIMVVTGRPHVEAVRAQLSGLAADNLLAEPAPRDSMPAIGLAAAVAMRRDPDAVIGSFAADHVIDGPDLFADAVHQAVAAAQAGHVVTIGITPTHPATGYGYIAPGGSAGVSGGPDVLMVGDFVEKPDEATAHRYVTAGYLWNAGMFVVRAATLLDHLAGRQPGLAAGLAEIADAVHAGGPAARATLDRVWPTLAGISIDHAIAEPVAAAGGMAVVPGAFAWDDVGDWDSLAALLPGPGEQARVVGDAGLTLVRDSTGIVLPGSGRTVCVLGIPDVVVVDTDDAVLVTTRDRAQQVKSLVEQLKSDGRQQLT
ncbi:MAG: mannose-1-phosphate guanylyltransferase [Micrococcales bacterium]|nr:MAG: mannose-1-phosphate guanylyltransferase [Micrococcales bacterium]